jgi:hypothetical protein
MSSVLAKSDIVTRFTVQTPYAFQWNSKNFLKTECSLSCSRSLTDFYSESDEPSTRSDTISLRSALILSSNILPDLPNHSFTSAFPAKIIRKFLISPLHTSCFTHLTFLDFIALKIIQRSINC